MFAATAAGVYTRIEDAIKAMNSGFAKEYLPNKENTEIYQTLYDKYLRLGKFTENELER
jgi:L-ribulokinase